MSVQWLKLGIRLERIEPGCPQQNRRHEAQGQLPPATLRQPSLRAQSGDLVFISEALIGEIVGVRETAAGTGSPVSAIPASA